MKKIASLSAVLVLLLFASMVLHDTEVPAMKPEEAETTTAVSEMTVSDTETTTSAAMITTAETTVSDTTSAAETTASQKAASASKCYRGPILTEDLRPVRVTKGDSRYTLESDNPAMNNFAYIADKGLNEMLRVENSSVFSGDTVLSSTGVPLGQGVLLSLNMERQEAAYAFLESQNLEGCVIWLDTTCGIKVLASYPAANSSTAAMREASAAVQNRAFGLYPAGSTEKIMGSVVASVHGIDTLTDVGHNSQFNFSNWDFASKSSKYPMQRSLVSAIRNSSNCYFAEVYYQLGAQAVLETLDKYFLYSQPIECDFGTLKTEIHFGDSGSFVRSAFGQRSKQTPMYTAMTCHAVITGSMKKAHIAKARINAKTLDTASMIPIETEILTEIPMGYREKTMEGMKLVAQDLKISAPNKTIYTKTGTAEVQQNGYGDFLTIVSSFVDETSGDTNTLLLLCQNPVKHAYSYASDMRTVYQELIDMLIE